jgi:MerR family transcriptional regulator, mercuric resistance operon regulatory protein
MRTSELAGRVGVNAETLRYYERRGLLEAPPCTAGGYRDYPSAAVGLLRFIKRAQELGFSLGEIEELVHLDDGGPDSCDAARALAEAHKADLEARIADLQRMRDSLGELIATCDLPRSNRRCALLEAIGQHATDRTRERRHDGAEREVRSSACAGLPESGADAGATVRPQPNNRKTVVATPATIHTTPMKMMSGYRPRAFGR